MPDLQVAYFESPLPLPELEPELGVEGDAELEESELDDDDGEDDDSDDEAGEEDVAPFERSPFAFPPPRP